MATKLRFHNTQYYLGIDGGGSKTTGVLSDLSGKIIRTTKLGAGNVAVLGREKTADLINQLLHDLLQNEGIDRVQWATFGLAGAGQKAENEMVKSLLLSEGVRNFTLITDAELLYYSIFGEEQGIVLGAGTGSFCIFRNSENKLKQLGGWGYLLGDEGSGYKVGRMAIRQAICEEQEGEPQSKFAQRLLAFYEVKRPKDFITQVHSTSNPQNLIASSARLVCELATKGDANAQEIARTAAVDLVKLATLATQRFNTPAPYKIALTGSLLNSHSPIAAMVKAMLMNNKVKFEYVTHAVCPAAAGVLHSVRMAGETVSESLMGELKKVTV